MQKIVAEGKQGGKAPDRTYATHTRLFYSSCREFVSVRMGGGMGSSPIHGGSWYASRMFVAFAAALQSRETRSWRFSWYQRSSAKLFVSAQPGSTPRTSGLLCSARLGFAVQCSARFGSLALGCNHLGWHQLCLTQPASTCSSPALISMSLLGSAWFRLVQLISARLCSALRMYELHMVGAHSQSEIRFPLIVIYWHACGSPGHKINTSVNPESSMHWGLAVRRRVGRTLTWLAFLMTREGLFCEERLPMVYTDVQTFGNVFERHSELKHCKA